MIYLDNNATTMMHPLVKEKMYEIMELPLNSSSIHSFGRFAKKILSDTRLFIYSLFGIKNKEDYRIIFTSSGTEANNLIISNFSDADIFISSTEHLSIYKHHEKKPNIVLVNVNNDGIVDLSDLIKKIEASKSKKKLVSIMMANHETGIVQDLENIISNIRPYGCYIHSDLVQAVGKMEINIQDFDLDFATISAHKFGGPCGAAALIAKSSYNLEPMIIGGGQQENIRSGTENIVAIAGFGKAVEILEESQVDRITKMKSMQNNLEQMVKNRLPSVHIVGQNVLRIPNTTMLINDSGKSSDTQLIAFDLNGIAVSSGSACSSGSVRKSNVLSAMGYSNSQMNCAIRISSNYNNNNDELIKFVDVYERINTY